MKNAHIPLPAAAIIALFVQAVGIVVAVWPSMAPYKEVMIAAGTTVLNVAFLVASGMHAQAAAKHAPPANPVAR